MLEESERVVLVHGLAEGSGHMAAVEAGLRLAGYAVSNIDYPSTTAPSAELAESFVRPLFDRFSGVKTLHFVTHSMGGILLRYCLSGRKPANLGRVVMLSLGHHGSPMLDLYRRLPLFSLIFGPAGQEGGLGEHCFACTLESEVDFDLGVLAGALPMDPLSLAMLPWPHDGRLSLRDVRLAGMRDLALIPASHDLIAFHPWAVCQTIHFLRHGSFFHYAAQAAAA